MNVLLVRIELPLPVVLVVHRVAVRWKAHLTDPEDHQSKTYLQKRTSRACPSLVEAVELPRGHRAHSRPYISYLWMISQIIKNLPAAKGLLRSSSSGVPMTVFLRGQFQPRSAKRMSSFTRPASALRPTSLVACARLLLDDDLHVLHRQALVRPGSSMTRSRHLQERLTAELGSASITASTSVGAGAGRPGFSSLAAPRPILLLSSGRFDGVGALGVLWGSA